MPVSPSRAAAFDVLLAVEERDAYASELLHSHRLHHLTQADRDLCTELVMGVLRWRSTVDSSLAPHTSKNFDRLDPEVLTALRLAAYQMSYTRVPSRAAVNESVELVKRARKRSAVPFVNAVLRKLSAGPFSPPSERSTLTPDEFANAYAHPQWLVSRWLAEYGSDRTRSILAFDQQVPITSLRLANSAVEAELLAAGIELSPGALLTSARRVVEGDVTHSTAVKQGRVSIQDEGSQLVAALVGRGMHLLDCCAAPGGKTAALAERNPQARIIAAELHPHRARLLRERVSARNVEIITADAAQLPFGAEFDRVLVDVPCSGTGTLARNPEIKWKLKLEDLTDLHARQAAILCAAMSHVAPGGRIVYSSCSLEREENEAVVEAALDARNDFRVIDCHDELQRLQRNRELRSDDLKSLVRGPYLRTMPGVHPCDGFFVAIFERTR